MQLECLGCRKNLNDVERHNVKRWEISNDGRRWIALRYQGIEYHDGDFVYLSHSEQKSSRLSGIARIVDVGRGGSTIKALRFKRCFGRISESISVSSLFTCRSSFTQIMFVSQQRHLALFAKGGENEGLHGSEIDISRLSGKCHVIHTTAWLARPDVSNGDVFGLEPHLYHADEVFTTPGPNPQRRPLDPELLAACSVCTEETKRNKRRLRQNTPLVLMDVFCGAGGMSQGFVRAGLAKAAYAIDISPSCCATYRYARDYGLATPSLTPALGKYIPVSLVCNQHNILSDGIWQNRVYFATMLTTSSTTSFVHVALRMEIATGPFSERLCLISQSKERWISYLLLLLALGSVV